MRLLPSVGRGSRKSLGLTLILYIGLEFLHVLGRTSSCVFGGQRRNQRHQFDPPSSCFRPKPKHNHRTLRNGLEDPLCLGCSNFYRLFDRKDGWSLILNDLDGGF